MRWVGCSLQVDCGQGQMHQARNQALEAPEVGGDIKKSAVDVVTYMTTHTFVHMHVHIETKY